MVLTMLGDEDVMVRALANGASGYLLKGSDPGQLADAVRTVARGEAYLGSGVPRSCAM